jgi:hypothetical protein
VKDMNSYRFACTLSLIAFAALVAGVATPT